MPTCLGTQYVYEGPFRAAGGTTPLLRSVWHKEDGDFRRLLLTAYPHPSLSTSARRRVSCPMRTALAALALVVAIGGAQAQQKLPTVSELLKAEAKATEACEAGGDAAIVSEQCRLRDRISGRLAQAGWCWGRKGQTDVKKEWHACQPDSIYEDDVEAVQP